MALLDDVRQRGEMIWRWWWQFVSWTHEGHIRIVPGKKPHIHGFSMRPGRYAMFIWLPTDNTTYVTNHFWFLLTLSLSLSRLHTHSFGHLHAFIITQKAYTRETDIKSGRMQGCMHHRMNYNLKHSDMSTNSSAV